MNHRRIGSAARGLVLAWAWIAAAVFTANCKNNDTIVGPSSTATPGPPPTSPPGPTATPLPSVAIVHVGQGGNAFVDQRTGSTTTTISPGATVQWVWVASVHSTTSGSCGGGGCQSNGIWDSGTGSNMTFSHTFSQAGTFPYFCRVHGAMMQGTVIVQ
jgi:plastocyanin